MAERDRIGELEAENERLRSENEKLREEVSRLRELLEEALRKRKRQCAPFSRDRPKTDPKRPGRKSGKCYGKRGVRPVPPVVHERYVAALPMACERCGAKVALEGSRPQYQEDIVRRTIVRLFDVEIGHCEGGHRLQGRHPLQTSDALGAAAVTIGPEALVLGAELSKPMGLSHGKIAEVLEMGFGLTVDRSTLCRALARMGQRARPSYDTLVQALQASPVAWMDETGWRVNARLAWLWLGATRELSVYRIATGRGFAQGAALLGHNYAGTLHHDGLALYHGFEHAAHQSCIAHLVRRCRSMIEAAGPHRPPGFPSRLLDLLLDALAVRELYDQRDLTLDDIRQSAQVLLEEYIPAVLAEAGTSPEDQRLAKHINRESPYLLTFLKDPRVEATNNRAEREIRPAVIARKTWGGSRTDTGARTFETLASVLRTARLQAKNSFSLLLPWLRSRTPFVLNLRPDTS